MNPTFFLRIPKFRFLARTASILSVLLLPLTLSISSRAASHSDIHPKTFDRDLPLDRGAVGLYQTLKRLQSRASLLMITAHPDDEDGGFLTYQSRGQGTRTSLLTLTRGEGGANVMSADFFDALGLVRTEELIAAARYYGVDPYWGSVTDYGFSKTREEAFDIWGKERALADAVRVIRMTRPLVLASVFIGGATDGHGNHQTTGQILQEAFIKAGDPNAFPDQIASGLRPWSPLKVYARVPSSLREGNLNDKGIFNYASQKWFPAGYQNYIEDKWTDGALPVSIMIPSGTYDPVLGQNYYQISREGLGMQKCQMGGSSVPPAGSLETPYFRFASRVETTEVENSIFDGIDTSISGMADLTDGPPPAFLKSGLAKIEELVEEAVRAFSIKEPEKVAPLLAKGLHLTRTLLKKISNSDLSKQSSHDLSFELRAKKGQFNTAIQQALGLSILTVVTPDQSGRRGFGSRRLSETFQTAIPNQKFNVSVQLTNQSNARIDLNGITLESSEDDDWNFTSDDEISGPLKENQTKNVKFKVVVSPEPSFTKPYYSRPGIHQGYYNINDEKYSNLSQRPYPLSARAELDYRGVSIQIGQIVQVVKRVTGLGTVLNPLVVAPAVSVSLSPHAGVIRPDSDRFTVSVTIQSNVKGPAEGNVKLRLPNDWKSDPVVIPFSTVRDGEQQTVQFKVIPSNISEQVYEVTAVATYAEKEYSSGYKTAGYPGLRPYNLYREASYKARGVDLKVASNLRVGYVMGTGDSVPDTMVNLGIRPTFLSDQDLGSADLNQFDVILLGVRTFAARPELRTHNGRLLDYVEEGGVVIVQYNTPEFDQNFGPYPYEMGRSPEEVTDESSPVKILLPDHPVLNWPNKITASDFEGWIEQRGSKFPRTWDKKYDALIETHDPGQEPQEGGFLYARHGKGIYVYCAYAFYRQLPEGVPGAFRLFANLVSLPKNSLAR